MSRKLVTWSSIAALALLAPACGEPHVALEAPGKGAPLAERQKSYERLRPAGTSQRVIVTTTDTSVSSSTRTSIILANGQTVHHAEDILPVVAADSPTAEAARRHAYHRKRESIGYTLGTIGLFVALGSIAIPIIEHIDEERSGTPDIWWPGVIGGGVVFLVGSGVSYYNGSRARDAKIAAFATYDTSLRENLDLCVDGTRLVDCGAMPPPPPAGGEPPPPPSPPPPPAGP